MPALMRPLFYLAALLLLARPADAAGLKSVEVEGTAFKVTLTDGRVLHSPELVGATLTIKTSGPTMRVRIDAVERDPDAAEPVWLHTLSTQGPGGTWENLCAAGPDGRRQAFPLAGRPRADGAMEPAEPGIFELVCTSGGRGKCVRFGYRLWTDAATRNMFNACVRMLRADYCGDGVSTTRDGTLIDIYDDRGIQKPASAAIDFEAGWTADGAVCVRHVRVRDNISPKKLIAACPRLKDRIGEMCTEEKARSLGAQIFNRSKP